MTAYGLATEFKDYVNRVWDEPEGTSDLLAFFVEWVQHDDTHFLNKTRGDFGLLMVTWALVSAWFARRPEDFPTIRAFVTEPAEFRADYLPFPFDKDLWEDWVFTRLHGHHV